MKKIIIRVAEGLGNQLFMYSNGFALSKENKYDLFIDETSGYFKKKNQFRNFELDQFRRKCLLEGLDDIALTLKKNKEIDIHEEKIHSSQPWIV